MRAHSIQRIQADERCSLIIITARSEEQREKTEDWIAEYMPDSPSLPRNPSP